jgi:hypothetical protein
MALGVSQKISFKNTTDRHTVRTDRIVDAVARVEQATHASYRDRNISQVRYFTLSIALDWPRSSQRAILKPIRWE